MNLTDHADDSLRHWPGPIPSLMHTNALPCRPEPIAARLARAAACSFCRAAAWMDRAARAIERTHLPEAERQYACMLLSRYGKLD